MTDKSSGSSIGTAGRYMVVGLITIAPLGITWLILDFLFNHCRASAGPG